MDNKFKRMTSMVLAFCLLLTMMPTIILNTASAAASTSAVGALLDSYASANDYTFTLSATSRIFVVSETAPAGELLQTVQLVQKQFAAGAPSIDMQIVYGQENCASDGDIVIKMVEGIADEGYQMEVGTKAVIKASDVDGLLYGMNMFQKMIRNAGTTISGFTAADTPDTKERTVQLDVARKYFTVEWICNFVRQMSWMGYNTLSLHFSEDGGFRADFWDPAFYDENDEDGDGYTYNPENDFSWLCGGHYQSWVHGEFVNIPDAQTALSTSELVQIIDVCKEYHIDVIPSFDSPSHMDYITWKFEQHYKNDDPNYSFKYNGQEYKASSNAGCINYANVKNATAPNGYYTTIDIRPGTMARAFVFALYEDIADFFKEYAGSNDFSIGADEVPLGSSSTWSYDDFPEYINSLNRLLNSKGYTMRMFNDFIGSTSKSGRTYSFDNNIEILYWDSPLNPASTTAKNHTEPVSYYVDQGRTLYNCIQTNTYFVLRIVEGYDMTSGDKYDARSDSCTNWTFYNSDEDSIYDQWYPADISEHGYTSSEDVADVPSAQLGGGYFLLWNDYAAVATQDQVWKGIDANGKWNVIDRMWSNTIKQWNWDINSTVTEYSTYAAVRDTFGYFPGYTDCSTAAVLPEAEQVITAGHNYVATSTPESCLSKVTYRCTGCGDTYVSYPDEIMTDWSATKPEGIDEDLIESITYYSYRDYGTFDSTVPYLDGCELISSQWVSAGTKTTEYVENWIGDTNKDSGIPVSPKYSTLYNTYNGKKVTDGETYVTKITNTTTQISGYIWYHWCAGASSDNIKDWHDSGRGYGELWAFYSTQFDPNALSKSNDRTKIDDATLEYYVISNDPDGCTTAHDGYWYIPVYKQTYTEYYKLFTYQGWSDWSTWSQEPVAAVDGERQVQTTTMYRYVDSAKGGHQYVDTLIPPTCVEYAKIKRVCSECGDVIYVDPDPSQVMSSWQDTYPEGIDASLIESATFYRYSDYVTTTSTEASLAGWDQLSSGWVQTGTGSIPYISSWKNSLGYDSFIPTYASSNTLYQKYNIDTNSIAYNNGSTKREVTSTNGLAGYLWYHWCYNVTGYTTVNDYYQENWGYTTLHAFDTWTYDPNALTPSTTNSGSGHTCYQISCTCGRVGFWYIPIYNAAYTDYEMRYTYGKWADYSEWSQTQVTASDTRKVETKTMYRYRTDQYAPHTWVDGVCSVCGEKCTHNWVDNKCTICGLDCQHTYSSETGLCTKCDRPCPHEFVKNGSQMQCQTCNYVCTHDYDASKGFCKVCGILSPDYTYYLTGTINGENYTADAIKADPGNFEHIQFDENGVLDITLNAAIENMEIVCFKNGEITYESVLFSDYDEYTAAGEATFWLTWVDNINMNWCIHEWDDGTVIQEGSNTTHKIIRYTCTGQTVDQKLTEGCTLVCGHTKDVIVHDFVNSICTVCGEECVHSYDDVSGVCIYCGLLRDDVVYFITGEINGTMYYLETVTPDPYSSAFDHIRFDRYGELNITLTGPIPYHHLSGYMGPNGKHHATYAGDKATAGDATFWVVYDESAEYHVHLDGCMHQWELVEVLQEGSCTTPQIATYACSGTTWDGHKCTKTKTVEEILPHNYVNNKCTYCGQECQHIVWNDGICAECGKVCVHKYVNDICKYCGKTDPNAIPPSEVIYYKTLVDGQEVILGWQGIGATSGKFNKYIPVINGYVFSSSTNGTAFTALPSRDGSGYLSGTASANLVVTIWYTLDADYDRLEDLLEAYPTQNTMGYTDASWNAYMTALNAAKALNTSRNADRQAAIDNVVWVLQNAHSKLVISSDATILKTEKLNASILQGYLASYRVTTTTGVEQITVFGPDGDTVDLTTCVSSVQTVNGEVVKLWLIEFRVYEFGSYTIGDVTVTIE